MQCSRVLGAGWLGLVLGCSGGSGPQTTAINTLGDGDSTGGGDATSATGNDDTPSSDDATSVVDTTMGNTTGPDPDPTTDDGGSGSSDSGAVSCEDDPAACTAWILPSGANAWQPVALDADSSLAPAPGSVQAAFDVEAELEGFVLTDSTIHVVDLAARTWVRSENRADALPDLGNDVIVGAYSIPSYWGEMFGGEPGTEGVTFLSATTAYIYEYNVASESFTFDFATTDFGDSWNAPAAPTPSQIRGSWIDVANDDGWISGDLMELCGVARQVVAYSAYVAASDMHVAEAGYCFEFFEPTALSGFPPFGLPQAPVAADVGGMLYNETMGLWVFR